MFNTFEKNIQQYALKALSICLNPSDLQQRNNSKDKSYKHKDIHSRIICSKVNYVNINVK